MSASGARAALGWLTRAALVALVAAGTMLPVSAHAQQDPEPTRGPRSVAKDLAHAMAAKDWARAMTLARQQIERDPDDALARYNLACALAQAGEREGAGEALLDAIGRGFVDFHHMERDPDLAPLRESETYRRIVASWDKILDARGAAQAEQARAALGALYSLERDEALRLSYVWAIDPGSFADAKEEVERVAEWARGVFPTMFEVEPQRPDPWVLVVAPTPRDFMRLVGMGGVGGVYDRDRRALITQDIGPSLRHEFFHVLHWRHMDRVNQRHPYWVMEGLAALLEDVDRGPGAEYLLQPSWRTNIAKRLERNNRLIPWSRLATMERDAFMGDRSRAHYALSRSVFMFLHERGVLGRWYELYVDGFANDPTGLGAIAQALEVPIEQAEKEHRAWLRELPMVAEQAHPGEATLGAKLGPGTGDGVAVLEVLVSPPARGRDDGPRLRRRDVIEAIDGKQVRTLDDLHRILGEMDVGDEVTLSVRRGTSRIEVRRTLVEEPPAADGFP